MTDPHYGGNLQNEIIKEEHDHDNRAKRVNVVAGTINAAGQATITPLQAWPDPKTYIGLVTITGSLAAASGNVTLDAGSKTQIVGNVTLSDPKTFIGLVTAVGNFGNTGNTTLNPSPNFIGLVTAYVSNAVGNATLNPSPNFIGIVTVANPSSFSGNVTLDAGSKTGITGNVTISDSKNYIGLVTATPGAAWPDPKGYIGLVTITGSLSAASGNVTLDPGSKTGITGNVTLSDSKTNIGLVTLTGGTAWADPKSYIGLVTITGSLSAASGNVTLDAGSRTGIVGNVTISDSKAFIGLVTVGGGVLNTVTAVTDITNPVAIKGNITLSDPKGFIGLVTIVGSLSPAAGNVTLDAGSKTQIVGNVTISDSKANIGLVTLSGGTAWTDPKAFIGLVTAVGTFSANIANVTLNPGPNYVGLVTSIPAPGSVLGTGTPGALFVSTASGSIQKVVISDDIGQIASVYGPSSALQVRVQSYNASVNNGDNQNLADFEAKVALPRVFNGLTWDRPRSVGAIVSAATVDTGLTATGVVGFDGTYYKRVSVTPDGILNSIVTVNNTARNITGNITLSDSKANIGLVTLTGGTAWTDPKTYIGLVTITGSLSAASGNVTLDAGSKTGIVGNVTISDSKGFIGLVTLGGGTAWADPKGYIGLVTITGSLSAAAGNVTLDPGSKTGIVGNVTISDSKAFIGLVTVGGGVLNTVTAVTDITNPVAIKGNITLSDPKGFIGLVTIVGSLSAAAGNITLDPGSKTGIVGNVTLSDSKAFIGLTTVNIGSSNTVVLGNGVGNVGFASVTPVQAWPDPKTYIGLVTITGSLSAAAGNVTLDPGSKTGITGNITISDSKAFIGLVTLGGGTAWTDPKSYIGLVTITGSLSAAAGNITLDAGSLTGIKGNLTLSDSKAYIGLVTATANQGTSPWASSIVGNLTLSDPKGFIGLVTIVGSLSAAAGNITLDPGSKTGIVGNVTISDSKAFIGLVTVNIGSSNTVVLGSGVGNVGFASVTPVVAWPDPKTYIGLVTITGSLSAAAGNVTLDPGSKTGVVGNVTLSDAKTYIGLVTATIGGNVNVVNIGNITLDAGSKVGVVGNVTLSDSKAFIGLVTAWTRNAGTTKTLINLPISFSLTSVATIAVPTNANVIYVTNLLMSANATTQIRLKSGVTYLTGNASIGVSLNPGGGWVQPGSPDAPSWIGLPSGALVVEKNDATTLVGGNLVYFQE